MADSPGTRARTPGPDAPDSSADSPLPASIDLAGLPRGEGRLALVTGVTGYIGGRLVPELLAAGFRVRAFARNPQRLRDRPWAGQVEMVEGDASDAQAVARALDGVDVAYYLLHSLGTGRTFEARDRHLALCFGKAAREAGTGRIVYLGGLYPDLPEGQQLSPHLLGRKEVEDILLASGVPVTVLRAAVILGSGSASFEMLRYLTERLPIMIRPKWLANRIQPIAVRDVLRYLVGAASLPPEVSRGFDIGGPDVVTYLELMQRYAKVAGLRKRYAIPVPVLTPHLSSHWINLVTPVPHTIAGALVSSIVHEVVVKERDLAQHVPDPPTGLLGVDDAIRLALAKVQEFDVTTSWRSASTPGAPSDPLPSDPDWSGGALYVDDRSGPVDATPRQLWTVIEGIGGVNGWYSWSLGWRVRGLMDIGVGGPGLRRGRANPYDLSVGDALDWWRVEEIRDMELLRLRAEMRLPGEAWLDLCVETDEQGRTVFRQRALFHPKGVPGFLYWQAIKPFHGIVFGGMQRNIATAAAAVKDSDEHWRPSRAS
ncbi:DUF2867 domain-containing protein [Quadrisphaera sp. KR29]|uniref:DUF2867 domain-containing protein n=1 Tax=Quadrisphaera sp. KR29 TaxID=3461391 RepID=UPI00404435EE